MTIHRVACFVIITVAAASAFAQEGGPASGAIPQPTVLRAGGEVVTLWPAEQLSIKGNGGAELLTFARNDPQRVQSVVNIHHPSIEVHLPPEDKRNGAGVIVAPGGGNNTVVVGTEGLDVADWLNERGIAAFILRYRIRPYSPGEEGVADSRRAVRVVRARAAEWGVDPSKIGFMGFSAGGEQAARLTLTYDAGNPDASDPIERISSRPDFVCQVYPGWRPFEYGQVPADAPPTFFTTAGIDDASHARLTVEFYNLLFEAGIPVEMHIYGHGRHGRGMSPRDGIPFGTWPARFEDWLRDLKMIPAV